MMKPTPDPVKEPRSDRPGNLIQAGGRLLASCAKRLIGVIDDHHDSKSDSKRPAAPRNRQPRPSLSPDQQLFLALFREHPELLKHADLSRKPQPKLRTIAEEVFLQNEAIICQRQALSAFHNQLHLNMLRDSGMLGIMHNLLRAAAREEAVRWDVYCGYAKQQMAELHSLEQACHVIPAKPDVTLLSSAALEQRLRQQLVKLAQPPAQTEYLPLYHALKQVSWAKPESLEAWRLEASAHMKKGMAQLLPEMQEALRSEYPEF